MKRFLIFLLLFNLTVIPLFANTDKALTAGISQLSIMRSYKNLDRSFISLSRTKKQTKNLSETDKKIIIKYVYGAVKGEDTYLLINCYLRENMNLYLNPKDITKPLKSRLKYYADSLCATISKVKLPQNTILYRGVDYKGFCLIFPDKNLKEYASRPVTNENAILLKNKLYSTTFTEKGFMSTAYDIDYAKKTKFIFEVHAPKNIQAVLVDGIEESKAQTKEIIINKEYKWKVTDVTAVNNKYYKITLVLVL